MGRRSTQDQADGTTTGDPRMRDELRKKEPSEGWRPAERKVQSLVNEEVEAPGTGPWDLHPLPIASEADDDVEDEDESPGRGEPR